MFNPYMTQAFYKKSESVLILDVIPKTIEVGGITGTRQVLDIIYVKEDGTILRDQSNHFKIKTDKPSGVFLLQAFHNTKESVMIMNIIPAEGRMDIIYIKESGEICIDNSIRFNVKIKKPSKIIKI